MTGRVEVSVSLSEAAWVVGARDTGTAVAGSTLLVRLYARRPAYGLRFRRDNSTGGGVGISSAYATEIVAIRAVGELTGLPKCRGISTCP